MALLTIVIAIAAVAITAYLGSISRIPKGLRAAPGPKGPPIVGSALDLPDYPEKQYMNRPRSMMSCSKLNWDGITGYL
jgi:hypothetical protein